MKRNKNKKGNGLFITLMIILIVLDIVLGFLYYKSQKYNRILKIDLSKTQTLKDDFENKYNEDHKKLIEIEEKYKKKEVKILLLKYQLLHFIELLIMKLKLNILKIVNG